MKIDFLRPEITQKEIDSAVKVLKSGWLTAWNPAVGKFESDFASYLGCKHSLAVSSGTAALHVALEALGIGKGDEVITTPLSWVASSNAILYTGAKPVFIDIDPETGLMDVNKVEKAISKRTKAILPVHLYGQMVDMRALSRIAKKHKLLLVEDACHAIESERDGVRPGALSDVACFSFHAAKNMTSGEGGAVVTNNSELVKVMKSVADSGTEKGGGKRPMVRMGYKYSITAFQVALLNNQLKGIKRLQAVRGKVFERYTKLLSGYESEGLFLPKSISHSVHAHHIFAVLVPVEKRDKIRERLAKKGISTDVHFQPIHLEPYYRSIYGFKAGLYPHAEKFGHSEISLPCYPSLSLTNQQRVAQELLKALKTT